jgi:adenosylcobinamide kinase / adenosylcobinamide-phosphate guanylyltransferase
VIALVIGGARSGKSEYAERLACGLPQPVTYVATANVNGDPDLAARVAEHRARRPESWATIESGADVVGQLRAATSTVVLDALGPWVAATPGFAVDAAALCDALREREGDTVVVSDEVGLGVHPATAEGRHFRDALGAVNQRIAEVADEVVLVVAGRRLRLEPAR